MIWSSDAKRFRMIAGQFCMSSRQTLAFRRRLRRGHRRALLEFS
jgi:hypothetical protein